MTDKSKVSKEFTGYFKKALDVAHQKKREQETNYYRLTKFIHTLKHAVDIDACIDLYFVLYRNYADDSRSKMIFAILLTQRISASDVLYLKDLAKTLDQNQASTSRLRKRFDELGDNEKNQIRGSLKKATRENECILDELKLAYAASHDQKVGSNDELYAFDPLSDSALQTEFRGIVEKCRTAWDTCRRKFDTDNWAQVVAGLQSLRNFLTALRKDELKLFQVLKWCREPLLPKIKKGGGRTEIHSVPYDPLTDQIYLWTVFDLFRRATTVKALVPNRAGFTKPELEFFYNPLRNRLYYSNYLNHYRFGIRDVDKFNELGAWHLWLVQFALSRGVSLVSDETFKTIVGILEAITKESDKSKKETAAQPAGKPKRLSTKELATWDYAKDYFEMGKRIGAGAGEFDIVYFENEDTRSPVIYVEFINVRGSFFEMDIHNFTSRVEATPRLIIWRDTQGLITLIEKYFAFLFTMFFPGFGYFNLFLKEGFAAVLKQIVTEEVIDLVIAHTTRSTASGGDGGGATVATVLSILTGRKKKIVERLGKLGERQALAQAKADLKALEGKAVPLLTAGETQAARLTERELSSVGVSRVAHYEERVVANKMIQQQEDKVARQLRAQEQKALEREEKERVKDLLERKGIKSTAKADKKIPKVSLIERNIAARSPEPPAALKARRELAADLERNHFPEGTKINLPRTPSTDAGRAQNLAATPKGSRTVMDVDLEINFTNSVRRKLGLPLRDPSKPRLGVVGTDGIEFQAKKYLFLEHKEVETIWANSYFSLEAASKRIDEMLQKHVDVARVLKPYGCQGFHYSTNVKEMADLLSDRIMALRKSLKDKIPQLTISITP